jgi:CPA2 family monovalent cation:H+ antiporter-2
VKAFGRSTATALTISASLGQIGEFSFILAGLGVGLGILPPEGRDLVLGGAIISILLNPVLFSLSMRRARKVAPGEIVAGADGGDQPRARGPVILVGYGRVGAAVAEGLQAGRRRFVVLDTDDAARERAKAAGLTVVDGSAADRRVLDEAGIAEAESLILAIPDPFEGGVIVQSARRSNPGIKILARAHQDADAKHLAELGADEVVFGERELAEAMLKHLRRSPAAPVQASH